MSGNKIDGESIIVYMVNNEFSNLHFLDISNNFIRMDLIYYLIGKIASGGLRTLIY